MPKTWFAPAKINLFLHINSIRDDGYHNLQTIFQLIDYFDELKFSVTRNGKVKRVSGNEEVDESKDLIIIAAKTLQKKASISLGVNISVVKKIPSGGGLGGGSSDAACTLIALNKLWNIKLSNTELMKIGLEIGADVPVFIQGRSSWAEGIGELLTPIKLPNNYFLVVSINKHISTKEIFSHKALTMTPQIGKMSDFSLLFEPHNDCLQAAIELENEILEVINYLESLDGYIYEPRMTGTGSCVFLEFEEKKDAMVAYNNLPKKWSGFIAQAINSSPIYGPS
jgi:4-diphosphocytidyl-2-C-methyl-D-erythritol kinase